MCQWYAKEWVLFQSEGLTQAERLAEKRKEGETMKNDDSEYFKDWTDEKLLAENLASFQAVYVDECYGKREMVMQLGTEEELIKRGYSWDDDDGWTKDGGGL